VADASGLAGGDKLNPYCELVVLDTKGNQMGKPKTSKVVRGKDPKWNELVELYVEGRKEDLARLISFLVP